MRTERMTRKEAPDNTDGVHHLLAELTELRRCDESLTQPEREVITLAMTRPLNTHLGCPPKVDLN